MNYAVAISQTTSKARKVRSGEPRPKAMGSVPAAAAARERLRVVRSWFWSNIVCLVLLTISAIAAAGPSDQPPHQPQVDALRAAADTYVQNRQGFSRFTCRFETRFAKARSMEEIVADQLEEVITAEGLWFVDGDKTRFELLGDPEAIRKLSVVDVDAHTIIVPFSSEKYIGDSSFQLTVSPDDGIANIHPPEFPATAPTLTPFNMNWMGPQEQFSPGRHILRALESREECAYEGTENHDGVDVVVITVGNKNGKQYKYYMDPERAFWPIETVVTQGGTISYRYLIVDINKTPQGLWYPAKSYWIRYPSVGETMLFVDAWRINEIRVDEPIKADAFCIAVPRGTTVCEPSVTKPAQYTIDKEEVVCVGNLKDMLAKARRIGEQRAAGAPTPIEPQQPRSATWRALVLGGNALVLLALAVILFWRRKVAQK